MTIGKTIALTRWTFVDKVMSLLFNTLSRLVITFLPRSKCLLISWLQSPPAVILEPPKINQPLFPHLFAVKWWHDLSLPDLKLLEVYQSLTNRRKEKYPTPGSSGHSDPTKWRGWGDKFTYQEHGLIKRLRLIHRTTDGFSFPLT